MPSRLLAISDIEGNFDGLVSFLQSNGVISADFDWTYGDCHLLINGDLVDRGAYPMAILWLIYKLEAQAEAVGGQVHVILGNHDLMNIQGWGDYAHEDFKNTLRAVTGMFEIDHAFRFLYSRNNEIGKWLRSKML
ncbi:MAG: metallophosphoesterase [Saprospiraceae bacterium]|nr:metallophosphoesterase [Saprospiraceae bacterium]